MVRVISQKPQRVIWRLGCSLIAMTIRAVSGDGLNSSYAAVDRVCTALVAQHLTEPVSTHAASVSR